MGWGSQEASSRRRRRHHLHRVEPRVKVMTLKHTASGSTGGEAGAVRCQEGRSGSATGLYGMVSSPTSTMVSQHVLDLCTSSTTLISELAKNPDRPVSRVTQKLFKGHGAQFKQQTRDSSPAENEEDELGVVARCGSFPHRPSDLFLQVPYCRVIFSELSCNFFDRSTEMSCIH